MKKHFFIALFVIGTSLAGFSQTGPPLSGPGPGGCFPNPCVPIDGGLSILIAAGIGMAGKKAYDYSRGEREVE